MGIGEIETFAVQVNGESVRPVDFRGYYGSSVSTVHVGTYDSRIFTPVCPEHVTGFGTWIKY